MIFKNTHKAIIDQETFDIVQNIRNGRRRLTPMGEMPVLSGMLFCADCGAKLYQVRARGWSHEQEPEFVELLTKKNERDLNRQFRECSRELEQATQRITKLDSIIQRLYEDNLDGKISNERFAKMTATYEQEQKGLSARVTVLRDTIAKAKTQRLNIDSFLTQVKKYTEVKELDAEIIRSLVERIDVFTPEKVPGTRTKKQTILIHWNFIGAVELPQEQKKSA